MKNIIFTVIFVAGVAWRGMSQTAVSYTNVISSQLTDWSKVVALPMFNSALGTLDSIEISLNSGMSTALTINNQSGTNSTGSARTEIVISLDNAQFGNLFGQGGVGNGVLDYNSGKYKYTLQSEQTIATGTLLGSQAVNSGLITDAGTLQGFTGTGTVDLNAGTMTLDNIVNSGGNTTMSQVTDAGLTTVITYNYSPGLVAAPEPSVVALLGAGVTGLWAWNRRRWGR